MTTFNFTPDDPNTKDEIPIPFFEEARADYAPYYRTRKTIADAKQELTAALAKLNAIVIHFQEGHFGTGQQKRYGYQIIYQYHGARGIILVAGLPLKGQHTRTKIDQTRTQALLNVADWWTAALTNQVFSPGSDPLIMNLLADGQRTIAQYIRESGRLPALPAGETDIIEGEIQ